LPPAHEISSG